MYRGTAVPGAAFLMQSSSKASFGMCPALSNEREPRFSSDSVSATPADCLVTLLAAMFCLTACGGGGASQPPQNPVPSISSISPSITPAGGSGFNLTVAGTGFGLSSVVQWNGNSRFTTFFSSTQITAAIPASDIAAMGTIQVTVSNGPPGGGVSSALSLFIGNPIPSLTS